MTNSTKSVIPVRKYFFVQMIAKTFQKRKYFAMNVITNQKDSQNIHNLAIKPMVGFFVIV